MGSKHFDWINVDVSRLHKSCSRPLTQCTHVPHE